MSEKHDQIAREDSWMVLAKAKGYRCSLCGHAPPYDERETFFETGMCGYCAHITAKDD